MSGKTKENKTIVSFALAPSLKAKLKKKQNYTQHIAAIVETSMGICPVCQGKWPHAKPAAKAKE